LASRPGIWAELSAGLWGGGPGRRGVAGAAVTGRPAVAAVAHLGVRLRGALVASLVPPGPLLCFFARRPCAAPSAWRSGVCRLLRSAQESTREMECFRPSWGVWLTCLAGAALNWCWTRRPAHGLLTVAHRPVQGFLFATRRTTAGRAADHARSLGLVEETSRVLTRFHVAASSATAATLMYRAVSYWFCSSSAGWPCSGSPCATGRPPCRIGGVRTGAGLA